MNLHEAVAIAGLFIGFGIYFGLLAMADAVKQAIPRNINVNHNREVVVTTEPPPKDTSK